MEELIKTMRSQSEHNWILRGGKAIPNSKSKPNFISLSLCFNAPSCSVHWFHYSLN